MDGSLYPESFESYIPREFLFLLKCLLTTLWFGLMVGRWRSLVLYLDLPLGDSYFLLDILEGFISDKDLLIFIGSFAETGSGLFFSSISFTKY